MKKKNIATKGSDSLRNRAEAQLAHHHSQIDIQEKFADDMKMYHELQVRQIELEMQNDELMQVQSKLDESLLKFDDLIDFSPNSYFTLSPKGLIYSVNLTGASLLGITRNELANMLFANFIVPGDKLIFVQCQLNLVKTKEHQVCELRMFRSDRQKVYVWLDLSLIKYLDGYQILVIVTDITLHKQVEDTQAFLLGNNWMLTGKDFFEALAEYLAKTLEVDYVCIDKLINETNEAQTVAIYFDGHYEDNVKYQLKDTPCGNVVGQSVCIFNRDVRHLFPKDEILQEMLAESYVGITLWGSNGKPIGLIAVISRRALKDTRSTEMVLKQVSIRAVSELEHRQVEEELREREFFFRESQRAALIGSFKIDFITRTWESSEVLDQIYGIDHNYIRNIESWTEICHPDDRTILGEYLWNEIILKQIPFDKEYRIIRKSDGNTRWVHVIGMPELNSNGDLLALLGTVQDVTERKQKDILLHQSEERFHTMVNAIPQLAWIAHADGFIYWYNQRWYNYTGTTPEQMEGWGWQQVHDPEVLADVMERWQNSISSGESFDMEFPIRGADGIFRTFLTRVMPLKDSEGRITQWFGTNTDVSEIKKAESALKLLSNELEIIIDNIPGLVFYKDVNNHYLRVNKYVADAYHMSKKQLEGIDLNELHTKEQAQAYYDADLRVIKSRKPELNFDEPWDAENGLRWVNTSKVPYIDNSGEVVGVIGVSIDNTERKLAEQSLQESEQRYKSLFQDNYSVMLLIHPETGEILDANPAATTYYGWSKAELCTRNMSEINTLSQQEVVAEMKKAKEEERNQFFFKHRLSSGEIREVEVYSGPIQFGENTMLYSLVHDITDRKIAKEALLQSESRYKSLFQDNPSTLLILDPDTGEIKDANPAACKFYGWEHDDLCKMNISEINPMPKDEISKNLQNSKELMSNHLFFKHRLANGEMRDVEVYSGPIIFGESTLIYATIHDITEQKKAQEALHVSEALLGGILNSVNESIWLFDTEGKILLANNTATSRMDLPREEIIGANFANILPAELAASRIKKLQEVSATGNSLVFDDERAGIYFEHSFYPVLNSNGKVESVASFSRDITERKEFEDKLRQSEEKFRGLVFDMQVGMLLQGPHAEILMSNPKALELLGLTEDQLLGKTSFDPDWNVIHEDGSPFPGEPVKDVVMGVYNPSIDKRLWLLVHAVPQIGSDGNLQQVVCTFIDISELKKAEKAIKESEEKFRNLVFDMEVGVLLNSPKSEIILANPKAMELLGLTEDQITGKTPFDPDWQPIHEDGSPFPGETHPAAVVIATGKAVKNVVMGIYQQLRCEHAWFLINAQPQLDNNGALLQVVTTFVEISDLREAQRELKESELRLKYHFENSPLGVVEWDRDFVVTQWSVEAERIFGWTKEETLGKPIGELNLIFEEDLPKVNQTMQRLTSGEEDTVVSTNRNITKTGSINTCVWYNSILFDEKGAMKSVMSLVQDITAQKQSEEALVESEYLFRESQRSAFIGSYKTNFKTGLWESSEVMDQIFGIDNTYIKNVEGWLDIIHPEDRDKMNQYLFEEVVGKRLPFNKEYRIIRKSDGEVRWILGMGRVGFDENNNLISLVGTIQDIHDRKLKEEALRKMNRTLAALSKSSQIMAQSTVEEEYLNKVCDIVVEDTDFAMVWIGYAENDKAKTIRPVASAGFNDDYLDTVKVSWADNDFGRGPTGVAVRTGKIATCNNMLTDPNFEPWREQALKRGYSSSIVFPLKSGDKVFGAFTIYAKEPDSFMEDEIKLLSKLANDLAHGIITIRLRKAHELAEEKLRKSHDNLEHQVKKRTLQLEKSNQLLLNEINERKKAEEVLIASKNQLRALTQRMDQVAEEERISVAREIHDELGHLLTVMKYDMESLANSTDFSPEMVKSETESLLNMLDSLIDTVRKISSDLRPGILDHLGLFPAIEWHIRQFQKRTKIRCHFDLSETDEEFNKNETTIIFRIVQETLTNIARHANATTLWLSAFRNGDQFILKATDNGKGFDMKNNSKPGSFGLIGMRERALSIGGEIQIESAPGKGTTIALILKKK